MVFLRIEHVPAVVFRQIQAERPILDRRQNLVGHELIQGHPALQRAAAEHAGTLHQVRGVLVERPQQVGNQLGRVLAVGM
jgi:hypothetical protein